MIGVCGFGRCGSTMVMEMLRAGGIPPVDGCHDRSHELDGDVQEWLAHAPAQPHDRAVKILDAALRWPNLVAARTDFDLFLWLDRDPIEQARSMRKLMTAIGVTIPRSEVLTLAGSFVNDRPRTLDLLRATGVRVVELRYEYVLAWPGTTTAGLIVEIERHVAPGIALDFEAMADAVHHRDGTCRDGLMFEHFGVSA